MRWLGEVFVFAKNITGADGEPDRGTRITTYIYAVPMGKTGEETEIETREQKYVSLLLADLLSTLKMSLP